MSGRRTHNPYWRNPIRSPEWMRDAKCATGYNPDIWFPHGLQDSRRAVKICGMCPVTMECLLHVAHLIASGHEITGIWAGRNTQYMSRQQARLIIERGTP